MSAVKPMPRPHLPVVGYLPARHKVSCAVYDPVPDHCDCGAQPVPVVRLSDALAAIAKADGDAVGGKSGGAE